MTTGDRIRIRREELGYSLDDLAKKMGYASRNSVFRYEKMDNLKLSILSKFADALDVPPSYLMGWSDVNGNEIKEEVIEDASYIAELSKVALQLDEEKQKALLDYARFLNQS